METSITNPKKRQAYPDRITLKGEALQRVDNWLTQIRNQSKGVKISRNDLVQWLIERRAPTLDTDEQKALSELFFDEVAFAAWMLKEVRERKKRQESTALSEILAMGKPGACNPLPNRKEGGERKNSS